MVFNSVIGSLTVPSLYWTVTIYLLGPATRESTACVVVYMSVVCSVDLVLCRLLL